jgi:hypothetical protein
MLFLSEGKLYDPPLFPNGRKIALNCTDGSVVWEINGAFQRDVAPIADGEMLAWNGYDGQIYAFGTGPSKTTVAAPDTAQALGVQVLVQGTVTDISAGSQQNAVAMNFPSGLPCVSDANMTAWMEYVYEQQPKPTDVVGVKVTVSVVDPNNNCYDVGTTTSDASGFFKLTFTPQVPGKYTVIATFAGSESYYGSSAETALVVNEAPQPTPAPTPTPAPMTDTYITGFGISMLVAIVVIGLVIILMLRKR